MVTPFILTEFELVGLLGQERGATILAFTARTDARLKKTGCPYAGVKKIARVNALVNFHYDAGVLRRLAKEGRTADEFRQGSSWHTPILGEKGELTPFCQHKTKGGLYLRVMVLNVVEESYVDENGVELTREEVGPWLPKDSEYKNQGLDNPLVFKTYGIDSIESVTLNGETYNIGL
jgi:hypothetical protein